MSALEIALMVAALLIGATGTFSPCGLSAIETIGPTGHTGGRRSTAAACATFLPGAIAGGVITFGSVALVGGLIHGAGGRAASQRCSRSVGRGSCPRSDVSCRSTGAG